MRDRRLSPKALLSVVLVSILFLAVGAPGALPSPSDSLGPMGALDRSGTNDPPTRVWLGADGEPMPFDTAAEVRQFLRDAEVISVEAILKGVTQPKKLLLELDGVRAHAIFRDVDVDEMWSKLSDGSFHMRLSDQDRHEVAAYEMAMLLGLDNVPPTVVRRIGPNTGSLQLWLENVIADGRLEGGLRPPDYAAFAEQLQAMELFDYLILNIDRNTGNYLIDADWKLWMIDHTRAFQVTETVPSPAGLGRCERLVWDRVLALDEAVIEATFDRSLTPIERGRLLRRIDRLQAHIADLIVERGINAVIF